MSKFSAPAKSEPLLNDRNRICYEAYVITNELEDLLPLITYIEATLKKLHFWGSTTDTVNA